LVSLQEQLLEVKQLYIESMLDLDDFDSIVLLFGSRGSQLKTYSEKIRHSDGSTWLVTRGPPPAVSVIENQLEEVKTLFRERHPGYPDEAPKANQAPIMKPGAWSVRAVPRGRRAFCSGQFSQATRFERKQRKMDWLQGRVNAPIVDRDGTEAHEAFMDSVAPSRRYNTEPTNGKGRRLRRSTRYQAAVRRLSAARIRDEWKCKTERAVRRDRCMLLITHGEVVL